MRELGSRQRETRDRHRHRGAGAVISAPPVR